MTLSCVKIAYSTKQKFWWPRGLVIFLNRDKKKGNKLRKPSQKLFEKTCWNRDSKLLPTSFWRKQVLTFESCNKLLFWKTNCWGDCDFEISFWSFLERLWFLLSLRLPEAIVIAVHTRWSKNYDLSHFGYDHRQRKRPILCWSNFPLNLPCGSL